MNRLVERLTRTHKVAVLRDDGTRTYVIEEALIEQLRASIVSGNAKSGTAGNKQKLPMDAGAFDLYEEIKAEANGAWEDVSGGRASNPDAVETIIALWAAAVGLDAEPSLIDWERRIEDLLSPPSVAEIDAPCVSCGVRDVPREGPDGVVLVRALRFIRDRVTNETLEARCVACGESWAPSQFLWLARAIAAGEGMTTV